MKYTVYLLEYRIRRSQNVRLLECRVERTRRFVDSLSDGFDIFYSLLKQACRICTEQRVLLHTLLLIPAISTFF